MAFTANASVMAETTEPQTVEINGFSCYERDGEYWTVLDGEEFLVINLDNFTKPAAEDDSGINPCSGIVDECPIGTPPLLTDWIYNGCVELNGQNNYTYEDRCYLTYGDYYSPIYYFVPKISSAEYVAKIYTHDIFADTYEFNVWRHDTQTKNWIPVITSSFNILLHERMLLTGSLTQIVDGIAFKFLADGVFDKELYYTITLNV